MLYIFLNNPYFTDDLDIEIPLIYKLYMKILIDIINQEVQRLQNLKFSVVNEIFVHLR